MSDKTGIAWTDATWNPVRGCTKVSAGCANCYAQTFAERWRGIPGHPYEQGFDVRLVPEALELPLRWRKPRRIFVNSMSDLFHPDVPDTFILDVFQIMGHAQRHTFQILTKRPERARRILSQPCDLSGRPGTVAFAWPLPNVDLLVSVENQAAADVRIPPLLATPAARRGISVEPLLGPVRLLDYLSRNRKAFHRGGYTDSLDWVIVGGESGPKARPCDVAWVRSVVEQTKAAGVPCFVKQLGANVEDQNDHACHWPDHISEEDRFEHDDYDTGYQGAPVRVRLRDRSGANPAEWPADLRVQQMPEAR